MTIGVPTGSAYRDKRGGWVAELNWKDRGIRRRWRGRTKGEAKAQLDDYRKALGDGLKPEEVTLDVLADQYVAALKRDSRPGTVIHAEWCLKQIRPHLGHILVADMTPGDVERMLHAVTDAGLSPSSVRAIRVKTRAVLQRAVRDRLVLANPVDAIPPTRTRKNANGLSLPPVKDVLALLDGMKEAGHPSWPMLHVIATAGLRTGEARGLRWADVDRKAAAIHVHGQLDRTGIFSEPKTAAGIRAIPVTPRIVAALDEMRARQAQGKVRSLYVFAGQDGEVPAPWTAHRAWTRAQEKAWGKTRLTVRGLRHLALSVLVAQGVALPDVAAHAGHADSRILSEVYAHALHGREARIRKALKAGGMG